jgi:stalled ribosome alternative rescue factor ArfA
MKREIITFKIEPMKHRAHKALFDDELPFKPKVEKPKKGQYHRRPKHRGKPEAWEDNDY